eukprot:evm.model.scf_1525.2 EVM.evm.TU.scf_1525.2   scf_1525:7995-9673(-)
MSKSNSLGQGEKTEGGAPPALPWAADSVAEPALGHGGADGGGATADEDMGVDGLEEALAAACPLASVGLEVNDKIEVKWEVENEDGSIVTRVRQAHDINFASGHILP